MLVGRSPRPGNYVSTYLCGAVGDSWRRTNCRTNSADPSGCAASGRLTLRRVLLLPQEIADQLFVSVNTIRSQLATLYNKLGVKSREQALIRLTKLDLIAPR